MVEIVLFVENVENEVVPEFEKKRDLLFGI